MKNIFTEHPSIGPNPQTYWQHFWFAGINSIILIYGGIIGIIHAFCPWWFPFNTSSIVIKIFGKLVESKRHIEELKKHLPNDMLRKKYLDGKLK